MLKYGGCKHYSFKYDYVDFQISGFKEFPKIYMSFICRGAPSTVHSIIVSTCEAIWNKLSPTELPQLQKKSGRKKQKNFIQCGEWKKKAEEFYSLWQFPNCIGATDGKHIEIQAPHNSGSLFCNYRKTYSAVLLTLVDAIISLP